MSEQRGRTPAMTPKSDRACNPPKWIEVITSEAEEGCNCGTDVAQAEAAIGARLVVHDDLLTQDRRHQRRQLARVDVAAARDIADDKRDRAGRPSGLCAQR